MANSELTQLIADRDNIRRAIRMGVLQCSVDSQTATFANMRDMRAILNDLNRQIAMIADVAQRKPQYASINLTRGV